MPGVARLSHTRHVKNDTRLEKALVAPHPRLRLDVAYSCWCCRAAILIVLRQRTPIAIRIVYRYLRESRLSAHVCVYVY